MKDEIREELNANVIRIQKAIEGMTKGAYDEMIREMSLQIMKDIKEEEDRDYIEKGRYEI